MKGMKWQSVAGVLLLLGLVAPAPGRAQVDSRPDPEREAVQQVIIRFGEYLQAGDLAAIEPLFRARGHILTDNATTHGWAEYRDQYLAPELPRMRSGYAHTAVEAAVRGDVAWVAFRRVFSGSGGTEDVQGRGTAVMVKVDDRWLIVHLHMSQ